MIRRLDVKIVLSLIVTVAMPLGFSVYLVARAIETSLDLGLNERVLNKLEQGLEVRRSYIAELKRSARLRFDHLIDSHSLGQIAALQDAAAVKSALERLVEEDPELISVRLSGTGVRSVEAGSKKLSSRFKMMSMTETASMGPYSELEAMFAVNGDILDEYNKAGDEYNAYRALVDAPPSYLKQRFVWVYMVILGAIVAVAITIGVFWSRSLARRIHRLSQATAAVAEGDLSIRVAPGADDEVGRLVESFNGMVADLETSRSRIAYLQKISAWQDVARRLAHEIKNPLTPIQLAAQQLREKYSGDDVKFQGLLEQSTEIIEEEVATLRRLTSDFSSFAKLPEVRPELMDLGGFMADCEASLGHLSEQEGVTLSFNVPTEPVLVLFDRIMMKRVIDNLVRNAAEALRESTAPTREITVTARRNRAKKHQEVEIRIEDNGPGIQPEHHPSIFDPYYTTKSEGTGLGLAITKKIVLEHNGQIWVEDRPTGGAAFVIVVPLAGADEHRT